MPLEEVCVPASRPIVRRYCGLIGSPPLARDILLAGQATSYQLLRNGQKNRRWLAEQRDYICGWLIRASRGGRIPLPWPNSGAELFLQTHPYQAFDRGQQ